MLRAQGCTRRAWTVVGRQLDCLDHGAQACIGLHWQYFRLWDFISAVRPSNKAFSGLLGASGAYEACLGRLGSPSLGPRL